MKRKKQSDEPEVIRFINGMCDKWSFSLPHLSEPDVRQLAVGSVPAWIRDDCEWWCSDHPSGAVNPKFKTHAEEAAEATALEHSA